MTKMTAPDSDAKRLAKVRKRFDYRTRYEEKTHEPNDEFLVRLLDERTAEITWLIADRDNSNELLDECRHERNVLQKICAERSDELDRLRSQAALGEDALERAREAVEAFPSYAFDRAHTETLVKEVAAALVATEREARGHGMTSKLFPTEDIMELNGAPVGRCFEGYEVVEAETITNHTRWHIHKSYVFRHDGRFYRARYAVGATEYQDGPNDDGPTIECYEVTPVSQQVTVYLPLRSPASPR